MPATVMDLDCSEQFNFSKGLKIFNAMCSPKTVEPIRNCDARPLALAATEAEDASISSKVCRTLRY
jgi:hypothetical protein